MNPCRSSSHMHISIHVKSTDFGGSLPIFFTFFTFLPPTYRFTTIYRFLSIFSRIYRILIFSTDLFVISCKLCSHKCYFHVLMHGEKCVTRSWNVDRYASRRGSRGGPRGPWSPPYKILDPPMASHLFYKSFLLPPGFNLCEICDYILIISDVFFHVLHFFFWGGGILSIQCPPLSDKLVKHNALCCMCYHSP